MDFPDEITIAYEKEKATEQKGTICVSLLSATFQFTAE